MCSRVQEALGLDCPKVTEVVLMEPKLDQVCLFSELQIYITEPMKEARALWQSLKGEGISVIEAVTIG